jgi:hypothetical protein
MSSKRFLAVALVTATAAVAQQPNTFGASLVIDGNNGPTYPMAITFRTNTQSTITHGGFPNMPYAMLASTSGMTSMGAGTYFGDVWDLPVPANPAAYVAGAVYDGFRQPQYFSMNLIGSDSQLVNIPQAGSLAQGLVPIGYTLAFQSVVLDPGSPASFSLTAATQATATQGPVSFFPALTDPDEGFASINLNTYGITLPFYGQNGTFAHLAANGYLTLNTSSSPPASDFTPTPAEFVSQPPKVAMFWTDLEQHLGTLEVVIDATPPGQVPYMQVQYTQFRDYFGQGFNHTFGCFMDTTGFVRITSDVSNNGSIYPVIVGIGPGNSIQPTGVPGGNNNQKDLSAMVGNSLLPTPYNAAALENFFEWFGLLTMPDFATQPADHPYDLTGVTLEWLPVGSGSPPAGTNLYFML